MLKRILLFVFLSFLSFFFLVAPCKAQDDSTRSAITVINLIRGNGLGHETDDIVASFKAQWQVTKEANIPATWLLQYGALENKDITDFAKQEMKNQEFGLLFEIDRNYAEKANIQFRGQGAWYRSDGLLLNSYDQNERRKFIDIAFFTFKEIFGYYPKTVGAWWIGGDSLFYMQKKYGITSVLRASDQFNLDFYSIWGTPWNIPYLASKVNEGIPAASYEESSKVVILQWAIRDPLKGYADATYSLQDYSIKGYSTDYVDYLGSIFLQKPLGNFVMGLENGSTLEVFQKSYKTMLTKANEFQIKGQADVLLSRDYAQNFLIQKKVFGDKPYFLSKDYQSDDQSFWYISENYRAAIHKIKDTIYLVDLRDYVNKVEEDFHVLPNSQSHLRINEPFMIDSMRFLDGSIFIKKTDASLTIKENNNEIELYAGDQKVAFFTVTGCTFYLENGVEKTFSFVREKRGTRPLYMVLFLSILYFGIMYIYKKDIRIALKQYVLLLLPICFAFPFLINNSTYLFDKKEMLLVNILFFLNLFSISNTVYISKIFPFIILMILNGFYLIGDKKVITLLYWVYYALLLLVYFHVPYFPLNKTTYATVLSILIGVTVLICVIAFGIFMKYKSKKVFIYCAVFSLFIILSLATAVIFSRSKLALTPYEIQALEFIKNQKKNVLYVEEVDYSILPIYKAVKPLLYNNYSLIEKITGRKWETVMRPENNVLTVLGYDKKLIVIPKYLGTDISDYEITVLQLRKIFDNAQIAIFEKI